MKGIKTKFIVIIKFNNTNIVYLLVNNNDTCQEEKLLMSCSFSMTKLYNKQNWSSNNLFWSGAGISLNLWYALDSIEHHFLLSYYDFPLRLSFRYICTNNTRTIYIFLTQSLTHSAQFIYSASHVQSFKRIGWKFS